MTQAIAGTVSESQHSLGAPHIPGSPQMAAFFDKLDSDVEKSRRALAAAEANLIEKKALCAAFPSTLPMAPHNLVITPAGHKAEADLIFEVATREEVLKLLDAFPGVPVLMLQGGCTSFVAEERFTEQVGTKATPVGEVVYRLATWVNGPQEEYFWWTHLAGKLVHVLAKTKDGGPVRATATCSTRSLSHTEHEATYSYGNLPDGIVTSWHGGSSQRLIPVTVHQSRGRSFRDAVAKPMDASAKTIADNCIC